MLSKAFCQPERPSCAIKVYPACINEPWSLKCLDTFKQTAKTMVENHCTQTGQSSPIGSSRVGHKIVYMAVKKGTVLVSILLLKIFFAYYCRLYIQLCICLTRFM